MKIKTYLFFILLFSYGTNACAQALNWVSKIQASQFDNMNQVEVDSEQNIIFAGYFSQEIDLNPGAGTVMFSAAGDRDIFIAKLDVQGNYQWGFTLESLGSTYGKSITDLIIDEEDNIYITGKFVSDTDFSPSSDVVNLNASDGNIFVAKYDPDGNLIWVFQVGNTNNATTVSELELDGLGHLYLGGSHNGFASITDAQGNTANINSVDNNTGDLFVAKFDANMGTFLWTYFVGSPDGGEVVLGLAADSNGDVYASGIFQEELDFDWHPFTTAILTLVGPANAFVFKLNTDGEFRWAGAYTTASAGVASVAYDIEVDSEDNVVVAGRFGGTTDFDMGPDVNNSGSGGVFITKIDSLSNFIWKHTFSSNQELYRNDDNLMFLDADDNIYHTGSFDGMLWPSGINSAGSQDVILSKVSSEGERLGMQRIGGIGYDIGKDIHVDDDGNLTIVGRFNNTVDFDIGSLPNYLIADEDGDFFITSMNADCVEFSAQIASTSPVICDEPGTAISVASGGATPYNYFWNTSPPDLDSIANFDNAGNYSLTVTDAVGCQSITDFSMPGTDQSAFQDYDLTGNLIAGDFRTGFSTNVWLDVLNQHCIPVDAQVSLSIDPLLDFVSATPAPDDVSGNMLTWNLNDLVFDSIHFTPHIILDVSQNAMIGDTVDLSFFVSPTINDADPEDNLKLYSFPIINSYDPNDKQVYPARCEENFIQTGETLNYTVRFQNTGNAEAINVHILDTLDANLDINSLKILGSSHPLVTEFLAGQVLNFRFDNILLADSLSNEPESHGYVVFELKTLAGLSEGTTIQNSAAIYFDFNPAIITNSVSNTVIEILPNCFPVSTNEALKDQYGINIYPNPVNDLLTIEIENYTADSPILVYDLMGRLVSQDRIQNGQAMLQTAHLPTGIFTLQIQLGHEIYVQKFVVSRR